MRLDIEQRQPGKIDQELIGNVGGER